MKQKALSAIVEYLNDEYDLELTDEQKEDLECAIEMIEMRNS
jgi:hypothetical protein